jgi:predicted dinucleotide-binding enzyme
MRIGIVGSGMIGATLGELWVKAGHEVFLSSRHPEALTPLVERLGERSIARRTSIRGHRCSTRG